MVVQMVVRGYGALRHLDIAGLLFLPMFLFGLLSVDVIEIFHVAVPIVCVFQCLLAVAVIHHRS